MVVSKTEFMFIKIIGIFWFNEVAIVLIVGFNDILVYGRDTRMLTKRTWHVSNRCCVTS